MCLDYMKFRDLNIFIQPQWSIMHHKSFNLFWKDWKLKHLSRENINLNIETFVSSLVHTLGFRGSLVSLLYEDFRMWCGQNVKFGAVSNELHIVNVYSSFTVRIQEIYFYCVCLWKPFKSRHNLNWRNFKSSQNIFVLNVLKQK